MEIATINKQMIRNYLIAMTAVIVSSLGVGELFYSPTRLARQEKINQYAPYVGATVVNYGKNFVTEERPVISP
ncbi:hypothetical protein [Gloeothece verrucosa]|uniref:Uncharacterized protein n=1 Tax=Gloeothece verrucosa (strain PCC 7822) TaxID=497965 RepID=E0U9X3_GLOV7|nr:hypothetical protein [Gloeothece verrucosa]ADN15043.1 hypothetical protein Cyan7822_3088 [Gloeothece verrucosa PCC 7822]